MKKKSKKHDVPDQGQDQLVIPFGNGWFIKARQAKKFLFITDSKKEAMSAATQIAKRRKSSVIVYSKQGDILSRRSYAQ